MENNDIEIRNEDLPDLENIEETVAMRRRLRDRMERYGFYNFNRDTYKCHECDIAFMTQNEYNNHNLARHVHELIIRCDKCGIMFRNDMDFNVHECDGVGGEIDNIPENPDGINICPICEKKYTTAEFVGEHYVLSHSSYQNNCNLDIKDDNGFPGYDILKYIGMIKYLKKHEIKMHIRNKERCLICERRYKKSDKKIVRKNMLYVDEVLSDSEIETNQDTLIDYKFNDDMIIKKEERKIQLFDKKLIEIYNKFAPIKREPLRMKCCKKILCFDCLRKSVSISNSIKCIFCTKDHTREELNYIKIVELSDTTDRSKWLEWWKRHVDIFY